MEFKVFYTLSGGKTSRIAALAGEDCSQLRDLLKQAPVSTVADDQIIPFFSWTTLAFRARAEFPALAFPLRGADNPGNLLHGYRQDVTATKSWASRAVRRRRQRRSDKSGNDLIFVSFQLNLRKKRVIYGV
jgi:hypothetical protein